MHCVIRSSAERLCDDLARAEEAKDGKKEEKKTCGDSRNLTISLSSVGAAPTATFNFPLLS